jgi:regulator of protease activity HflC (stomatin/prohibitin superfamily)
LPCGATSILIVEGYSMLGIRYVKVPPTTFVIQYRHGKVKREGAGLAFFYFAPSAELVQVPLASTDVPFVFNEVSADFQDATIQGELTYRITEPKRIATILDYSITPRGNYRSDDPTKLNDRLTHAAQLSARSFTQRRPLRDVLVSSDELIAEMLHSLKESPAVTMLGVEILGLSVQSIKATPEMSKALQAEAREQLLRKADEAVYARRNAAVELERTIKENELSTEIVVEQKKRVVRETQMGAEISVEEQRADLVDRRVANQRKEADARAHALQAMLEPLKSVDWRTLMAAAGHNDAKSIISLAFRDLAENAGKIGELNISPDLLSNLLNHKDE